MVAKGKPETRALSLWVQCFSPGYSGEKTYPLRAGMSQMIIVDLDGTLSDPGRKLEW